MAKISRKSLENQEITIPKLIVFVGQKVILRHYYMENVRDTIQIRVYKINKKG